MLRTWPKPESESVAGLSCSFRTLPRSLSTRCWTMPSSQTSGPCDSLTVAMKLFGSARNSHVMSYGLLTRAWRCLAPQRDFQSAFLKITAAATGPVCYPRSCGLVRHRGLAREAALISTPSLSMVVCDRKQLISKRSGRRACSFVAQFRPPGLLLRESVDLTQGPLEQNP